MTLLLGRFSFECRKVIGFAFTTLRDWLKKLAPLFHPIRNKTKTNRDSLVRVFPRFASATCNYFVFLLVHLIVCVRCDWLEWLLWFWFYDTQLKTALTLLLTWIYSRTQRSSKQKAIYSCCKQVTTKLTASQLLFFDATIERKTCFRSVWHKSFCVTKF